MAPIKRRSARLSASHLMKKACKICSAPTLICATNPEKPGEVDGKSYVWPKCKCALTQKASKAAKAKIKPLKRVKKAAKVNKAKRKFETKLIQINRFKCLGHETARTASL